MPREKHGQHDTERKLPDNTDQPVGSGLIIWLHEQICQLVPGDGEALIEQSRGRGSQGITWLLEQLGQREGTGELIAEYHTRRKRDAVERDWEYKAAHIRAIEKQLATQEMVPSRRAYLEKELAKKRRLYEKHLAQQGVGSKRLETEHVVDTILASMTDEEKARLRERLADPQAWE